MIKFLPITLLLLLAGSGCLSPRNNYLEAKDFADESIRKYNKWIKDSSMNKEMEKQRSELREKLNSTESKLALKSKKAKNRKRCKKRDFPSRESPFL